MKGKKQKGNRQPSDAGRSPEDGRVSAGRGSPGTGLRACRRPPVQRRLKPPPAGEKITGLHSAQAARSCSLPTERRRSNSRGSLRIVSGLAENTNSIFCDGPPGPETANGCPVLRRQEPLPRGTRCELRVLKMFVFARSSVARVRRTVFSLDNDLHGCRQTVSSPDCDMRIGTDKSVLLRSTPCLTMIHFAIRVSFKRCKKLLETKDLIAPTSRRQPILREGLYTLAAVHFGFEG